MGAWGQEVYMSSYKVSSHGTLTCSQLTMVNNTACLGVASRVGLGSSYGKKKNGFLFVCLFVCYHMQ